MKRPYWRRLGDSLSQLLNTVILNGDPDESTSGRCFRKGAIEGNKAWLLLMKLIDILFYPFEKNHCHMAFLDDLTRAKIRLEQHREAYREWK